MKSWEFLPDVLGLAPDATKEDVKKIYTELSLLYHPDIGDDDLKDAEHFKILTAAYQTFMNQEVISDGQGENLKLKFFLPKSKFYYFHNFTIFFRIIYLFQF